MLSAISVPENVLEGLEWVRWGHFNYLKAGLACFRHGYEDAAEWILNNKSQYEHGLRSGFEAAEEEGD